MRFKKPTLKFLLPVLLLSGAFVAMAYRSDDDPFTAMLQKLKTYTDKYPQEKIHLHLDKPYYAAGDDIWFKAYVVNAMNANLTSISGVLYVELINESDSIKKQLKLPLISGLSWGSFKVPDSFTPGNYRIRAYTQWMRNAGPDFFFDQTIKIGNNRKNTVSAGADSKNAAVNQTQGKTISAPIDIQFFPEGGNFVEGQPNKLGIKAVNSSGLGEDISGTIVDNLGVTVASFSTKHLGMGNVMVTPKKGKTYVVKIKDKNGAESTVNLPKLLKSGYVLSVDQNAENILVKVLISDSLLNNGVIKLAGLHNSSEIFVLKAGSSKQIISTSIPKKDLPSGIMQLTLFNTENLPVCERLLFINNANGKIVTAVTSAKKTYAPKEETALDLDAGLNNKPVLGSFSVAITNTVAVTPDEQNESNIFTSLLLTSDLNGYIEKPNYYFLDDSEKTKQDLDNLMLTQGWRRVLWKNVISKENPNVVYQPEKSLKISGTITTSDGTPVAESKVSILATSGINLKADTITDAQGRFNFDGLNFGENAKFLIQTSSEKTKKDLEIRLDAAEGQQLVTKNQHTGDLVVNVNEAIASYLKQDESYFEEQAKRSPLDGGSVLKENDNVKLKNFTKNSANLNGPGNADVVITSDELLKRSDLGNTIEQKVSGLSITSGVPYILQNRPYAMMIVVDGFNVDSTFLNQIKPFNVQAVEILTSLSKTSIYGRKGALSGVLVITTKKAGDDNTSNAKSIPGVLNISPKGYNFSKEFYSPVYKPEAAANVPDHRTTIYWAPNVVTSAEGKAKISYFNAGEPGTYRVVIEGIDMLGNLSHTVYTYDVR